MRAIPPLLVLCLISSLARADPLPLPDSPPLPAPPFSLPPTALTLLQPAGPPQSVVVLFSDARWGTRDQALATRWQRQGALVIGLDSSALLAHINTAEPGDCTDLANTLEGYSQDLQKALAVDPYLSPILAGTGTGGALALATMAGADVNTYGAAVVSDPAPVVPAQAPICRRENDPPLPALAYGFTAQDDPVRVLLTPTAPPETRRLIRALTRPLPAIRTVRVSLPPDEALARRVSRLLANRSAIADAALVPLPATASRDLMAIVLSGDGGWRDLDREIALQFQKEGIPTLGIDSLRTFWTRQTPQATAALLSRAMARYGQAWGVRRVVLVGYSFGADVLPATFAALPEADRARVVRLSLLALSPVGDFEVSLSGWMGRRPPLGIPTLPDLEGVAPGMIQCAYGEEEAAESACPALEQRGADVLRTAGGHHFDGDYGRLARWILKGL